MSSGLARSVQTRLVHHAHAFDLDPNLVLSRYATERLLYRLGRSEHADRFVLKGALLLLVWLGEGTRPTRDADLLGFGELDAQALRRTFEAICELSVEPDGLTFDTASIRIAPIRREDAYGGQRVTLTAYLGRARLRVQVDVGIGDDVVPAPEWIAYPSLLDLPAPRLRAYRPETAVAEKVHAMVVLGSRNSRMRDFFDLHALSSRVSFDGETLSRALEATFTHRGTAFPNETPIALTPAFAALEGKRAQWTGFLRRSRLDEAAELAEIIERNAAFIAPVLTALAHSMPFSSTWPPGGPWDTRDMGAKRTDGV